MYPFERFTERAKKVLTLAQEEAERSHHSYIGTEHLLLAVLQADDGAARILNALGVEEHVARASIERVRHSAIGYGSKDLDTGELFRPVPQSWVHRTDRAKWTAHSCSRTRFGYA